jgi:hypothetical protein
VSAVLGLSVRFVADGGRTAAVVAGRGAYRPNWGLPGMTPPGQTGAPVLGFSRDRVEPGEQAYAVVVPLDPSAWEGVAEGDVLPCYEGVRVVAYGTVLRRWDCPLPLNADGEARLTAWLADPPPAP